jgi:hypothetical protein
MASHLLADRMDFRRCKTSSSAVFSLMPIGFYFAYVFAPLSG